MNGAMTSVRLSPELLKVAEIARRKKNERILALARYVDEGALARSLGRLKPTAAVGVDGVTVKQYEQNQEENLRALHGRMKAGKYRHQPIRRVYIPKENGTKRPIGISCVEDKVVQGAIADVLGAVYEQDFLECSYGFRPGRSAHDAMRAVDRAVMRGGVRWLLEADIVSFFDSVDRKALMEMLRGRIADESLMRLVGKCLHVGILDGEEYTTPSGGTGQGSALSPLLGNIYLHHVLDTWFENEIQPRLKGRAVLIRYADDFVIGFETEEDARRVYAVLPKRMARYSLKLHDEKTRLLDFRPPSGENGRRSTTFDFLGFTVHWQRTRGGGWRVACKTRRARLARTIKSVTEWCRRHRHLPVATQHKALMQKLTGHYNYFGVNGNDRPRVLLETTKRAWHKWLNRRSQRSRMSWERFNQMLKQYPLPNPRVCVQLWA